MRRVGLTHATGRIARRKTLHPIAIDGPLSSHRESNHDSRKQPPCGWHRPTCHQKSEQPELQAPCYSPIMTNLLWAPRRLARAYKARRSAKARAQLRCRLCFDTPLLRGCASRELNQLREITCTIGHALTQAQRPHVCPDSFDVLQALRLGAPLASRSPTGRNALVFAPYRILFFVVDDDEIHLFGCLALHGHAQTSPCCRPRFR
jgi:hypothetical protein